MSASVRARPFVPGRLRRCAGADVGTRAAPEPWRGTVHCEVGDVRVHDVEHGDGLPFVALHGAGVDHREIAGALEPAFAALPGFRRIYPDLPGTGGTAAPSRLGSNDDVVDVLVELVDRVTGGGRFLVGGHSWGGYLARAVAARRLGRVAGLALIRPVGRASRDVPPHTVLRTTVAPAEILEPDDVAGSEEYFVIRTPQTARH